MQGDRQGIHHEFTIAQDRQIVLLAIAVTISGSHHLINIYTFFQTLNIKGYRSRTLGIDAIALGFGIQNLHTGIAVHLLVRSVEEFHHDAALVAFTQESRHVRLYHHGFLSHSLIYQASVSHLLVVR